MNVIEYPCYLINAEKGTVCLPVKTEECLGHIFYYLERCTKINNKLKQFQEMQNPGMRKILKHMCINWLSVGKC